MKTKVLKTHSKKYYTRPGGDNWGEECLNNGRSTWRNETYKLYRDGRFYDVPADLKEERNLEKGQAGERGETARTRLNRVLENAPPSPRVKGGKSAKERPIHPDWKNIVNPND